MRWMLAAALVAGNAPATDAPPRWDAPGDTNPVLPGYFADPSIVHDGGLWYVFATIDPWGGDRLGLWTSSNGRDWRFSTPTWPTKQAARSATAGDANIWAPSVVKAANGRWYMYVSIGSEIWVGTAPSPAGPWRDANGGKPLIARDFAPAYHMIDAEAFVDDDGRAYLYWGSGLNWVNGHCFVVALKPDMVTFDGTPRDVTPTGYFEAPFVVKAGKRYLLTYSDGNTTKDTYKVRYAVGDSPLGPFTEGATSPILETHRDRDVVSPGHHAVFRSGGDSYILYHRQALPWPRADDAVLRQVSVDRLRIGADGVIVKVVPTHGIALTGWASRRSSGLAWRPIGDGAAAADDNYATLWRGDTLVADLGKPTSTGGSETRPEFATKSYRFTIDASADGKTWRTIADRTTSGSPITLPHRVTARYLRLQATRGTGIWEWIVRP